MDINNAAASATPVEEGKKVEEPTAETKKVKAKTPSKTTTEASESKTEEGSTESKSDPVKPAPDFKSLTDVQELVDCYNEMTLTASDLGLKTVTVKSFADVKTGVLACERLHAQISVKREEKNMGEAAKKTTAKRTAVKGKTSAKKPAKVAKAGGGAKRTRIDPKSKIVWVGKGKEQTNPFREGTGKHERVERLRKHAGKTVDTFLKAGGASGTLTKCVSLKLAKIEKVEAA